MVLIQYFLLSHLQVVAVVAVVVIHSGKELVVTVVQVEEVW
jgi:hypothetical protein